MPTATKEHFFRRTLRAVLPLLVWILHFAFCYGLAAAQCSPGGMRVGGPDRMAMAVATAAALGACAWLTWRGRGVLGRPGSAGLWEWSAFLFAALSFMAVAWSSVPLFIVDGCA